MNSAEMTLLCQLLTATRRRHFPIDNSSFRRRYTLCFSIVIESDLNGDASLPSDWLFVVQDFAERKL